MMDSWVLLKGRCSFKLRIDLLMMIKGRNVTTGFSGSSFCHWIYDIGILLYECLSCWFKQISTLHRSSYDSLVNLVCNPLSFMLKHRLRHVRNRNVWLLGRFVWIKRSLPFFFDRPHCVWGYRPGPGECIRVFREWCHCISDNSSLNTFMNLIFEILIWPLRSLSITNKARFDPRIFSPRNLLVVICKCEILLLNEIVSGNSWWRLLVFKICPLVLFLIPICLSIVWLLNTNIRWWLVLILLKVISYSLGFSFVIDWFEMFKLAYIKFMSSSHLFLMHL